METRRWRVIGFAKCMLFVSLLLVRLHHCHSFSHSRGITGRKRFIVAPLESSTLSATAAAQVKQRHTLYRKDYEEPAHWVKDVSLSFQFYKEKTLVKSTLIIHANENHNLECDDLILNGDTELLNLISLSIGAHTLVPEKDYTLMNDKLMIASSCLYKDSASSELEIVVELDPRKNENLQGLYYKDGMYCTHCEPTGFSKISFFPDRPDNCATFHRVYLEADKEMYPILLSNGNLIEQGVVSDDETRHYIIYQDPLPKPCYLFACVIAGNNYNRMSDVYTTKSGRHVNINLYWEKDQKLKMNFAINTIKNAMKWDEETYGLEYDADTYTVVAAEHYSIGAMENKGLNIFKTSLIATDPSCTTDVTYDVVEKTIAHEYFHNWSGNRVTIRDWFEFTLKEGLTVYRDQEFTSDIGLKVASRIESVKLLREKQFVEDAALTRQPIRPESYDGTEHSLDVIATSTTYHKGAEVFRMYKTILTKKGFRDGISLYMERHDGTGATCDDFHKAMADSNPDVDLSQFKLWYSTPRTPIVSYSHSFDSNKFQIALSQQLPGNDETLLHIPIAIGLMDKKTGEEVVPTTVLNLKERSQTFVFEDLKGDVVPSILRDFSAPIILQPMAKNEKLSESEEEEHLSFLAMYDTDGFNKWESMQTLLTRYIFSLVKGEDNQARKELILKAIGENLRDETIDPSSKAKILSLPTELTLTRVVEKDLDPVKLFQARKKAMNEIAVEFLEDFKSRYDEISPVIISTTDSDITNAPSRANRALRNVYLEYLCSLDSPENVKMAGELALKHFDNAVCFNDQFLAFRYLASMSVHATEARTEIISKFYDLAKSNGNAQILNKWFQIQALNDDLSRVQALTQIPDFKANNAGNFRALITTFTLNSQSFHTENGYKFIGDIIRQMDKRSPILAVELANKFCKWPIYEKKYADLMKQELHKISLLKPISKSLQATVSRALPNDYRQSSGTTRGMGPAASKKAKKGKKKKAGKKGFS